MSQSEGIASCAAKFLDMQRRVVIDVLLAGGLVASCAAAYMLAGAPAPQSTPLTVRPTPVPRVTTSCEPTNVDVVDSCTGCGMAYVPPTTRTHVKALKAKKP